MHTEHLLPSTLTRAARAERRAAITIAANWPDAIEETAA